MHVLIYYTYLLLDEHFASPASSFGEPPNDGSVGSAFDSQLSAPSEHSTEPGFEGSDTPIQPEPGTWWSSLSTDSDVEGSDVPAEKSFDSWWSTTSTESSSEEGSSTPVAIGIVPLVKLDPACLEDCCTNILKAVGLQYATGDCTEDGCSVEKCMGQCEPGCVLKADYMKPPEEILAQRAEEEKALLEQQLKEADQDGVPYAIFVLTIFL